MTRHIKIELDDLKKGFIPIVRPSLEEEVVLELPFDFAPEEVLEGREWIDITTYDNALKGYRTWLSRPTHRFPKLKWIDD